MFRESLRWAASASASAALSCSISSGRARAPSPGDLPGHAQRRLRAVQRSLEIRRIDRRNHLSLLHRAPHVDWQGHERPRHPEGDFHFVPGLRSSGKFTPLDGLQFSHLDGANRPYRLRLWAGFEQLATIRAITQIHTKHDVALIVFNPYLPLFAPARPARLSGRHVHGPHSSSRALSAATRYSIPRISSIVLKSTCGGSTDISI